MQESTVVITGGTKGIGLALVQKFLNQGFNVFTCGSSPQSVENLRSSLVHHHLDVSIVDLKDKVAIRNWAFQILDKASRVDVLINNAGRFLPGSIGEEEENTFEELIATNLGSAYHATRAFLPEMKVAGKGHIFNICSTASLIGYTNGGSYCISKFGLLGLSKVLREELKPFGIKVSSVLPGATFTDSWASSGLPESRFMKPEDIADVVWGAYSLSPGCVVEEILLRPLAGDIS